MFSALSFALCGECVSIGFLYVTVAEMVEGIHTVDGLGGVSDPSTHLDRGSLGGGAALIYRAKVICSHCSAVTDTSIPKSTHKSKYKYYISFRQFMQ